MVVLVVTRGLLATSGCLLPEACCLPASFLGCYYTRVIWLPAVVSVVATNSVFLFPTSPGKMSVGFGERGLFGHLVVSLMPY